MERHTVMSFAASGLLAAAASGSVLVGPVTNPANGHRYYLLQQGYWPAAQQEAVSLGGNLVTINDAAENAFVLSTFGPSAVTAAGSSGGLISLWIGLNDAQVEGSFVWADGSVGPGSTYRNFAPGEPSGNNADEDYIGMYVARGSWTPGLWHDIVSNNRFNDVTFGVVEVVPPVCAPDIGTTGGVPGHDGHLDNNDFIVFIDYFFNANPLADVGIQGGIAGHDGQFNNNDFVVFIDAFFAGCG